MRWLFDIGILLVGCMAGLVLGDLLPEDFLPKSWRIPIGAFLVGAGIALALMALS